MDDDGHDFNCCTHNFDRTWRADQAGKIKMRALEQAHAAKLKRVTELVEAYACLIKNGHEAGAAEMWKLLGNELDTTD